MPQSFQYGYWTIFIIKTLKAIQMYIGIKLLSHHSELHKN